MKTFADIRENLATEAAVSYSKARDWVFDKLENTEMDSGQMKAGFIKKFGRENVKHYERAVSEYMD